MSSRPRPVARATSEETKNQIKAAAQMLFAQRGVDGVTVQEIVNAAGQRNNAALHYHFGSKEELIRRWLSMALPCWIVADARCWMN
jgi:AcrR family transcriptional regulator